MTESTLTIGLIVEEFFREDLRGFGGFGKSTQYLTEHFNGYGGPFRFKVLLSQGLPQFSRPGLRTVRGVEVLVRPPDQGRPTLRDWLLWRGLIRQLKIDVFLTVDFMPSYCTYLLAAPRIPAVIWFRDPRGRREWEKMAGVPLELEWRRCHSAGELMSRADDVVHDLKRLLSLGRVFRRRVAFAANGEGLAARAREAYSLPGIRCAPLPNPIPMPASIERPVSPTPLLVFVGRLDPVKRPWIVLELARRFPGIQFLVLGASHDPEKMNARLRESSLPLNVQFMGMVDGVEKEQTMSRSWGLLNTSVHEGVPVTFIEAFALARPVISCVDPEGLVSRFGYFSGEIEGDGLGEEGIERLGAQISHFLADSEERLRKGREAQAYVRTHYSFESFDSRFRSVVEGLSIDVPLG